MILEILTTGCWFQAQRVIFQNLNIDRRRSQLMWIINDPRDWFQRDAQGRKSDQGSSRDLTVWDGPLHRMEDPDPSLTSVSLVPPALLVLASLGSPGLNDHLKPVSLLCLCSVQFSLVAQSCLTLCDPMDCSTPGLPVYHQLRVGNK